MNTQIQAITDALSIDLDGTPEQLHLLLVNRSQKLRQTLDKVTGTVTDREAKYARIKELRAEMTAATDAMAEDGANQTHRPVTKIAADLKRVNDSLDKDIDKVYDLISDADTLRREVSDIVQKIADVPLVATAA